MNVASVGASTANNEITLLPKNHEKAQRIGFYDDQGKYVFCHVWYSKGEAKTSPIMVHVEYQKSGQDEKKDVGNDLFSAA